MTVAGNTNSKQGQKAPASEPRSVDTKAFGRHQENREQASKQAHKLDK